jgi:hypothetical protein
MALTKATTNVVNLDKDTLINGLTVGKGGGNIATNTASGTSALAANTTGASNTALGYRTLAQNVTGTQNTAVGYDVLDANTGHYNTGVGSVALAANTTGINNTAVGYAALDANTTASNNTAVGYGSLTDNTTGESNVAVGFAALNNNQIGNFNTALGRDALASSANQSNTSSIGYNADVTASNQVQLGNSATTTYAYGAVQNRSDIRDKADIRDTTLGLEFVNALRPVDFKWDMREDYRAKAPKAPEQDATEEEKAAYKVAKDKWLEDVKLANIIHDGSKKRTRFHHGLIAQEVKAVLEAKGIDFGGFQDHSVKGGDDVLSIGYEELIAPLIKAVQELSAEVAVLKAK